MQAADPQSALPFPLKVTFPGPHGQQDLEFSAPFRIGRVEECEVRITNEYVSRFHAQVAFENGDWWIRDLDSSNGVYLDGSRVNHAVLSRPVRVRLGVEGPELLFEPQGRMSHQSGAKSESHLGSDGTSSRPARGSSGSGTVVRRYIEHYFSKAAADATAGEHTMYVRRAFAKVQSRQKRTYTLIISLVIAAAICVGGYALFERRQLQKQRAMAEDLFYAMKSLDLQIAQVEKEIDESGNQQALPKVREYARQRSQMLSSYDEYLQALHIYDRNMTEKQRIILRIARVFGECELDMPADFETEINKYIRYWQQSDRLATSVRTAQQNGYVEPIYRELLDQGLPPQFFYLALQESNFDVYASGPMTRKGVAKGMWQFIPETAVKYGLRLGPLVDLARPDPGDERDHFNKATKAAGRYLKDLYSTDAQASGFLVMACYNWGENQVLPLVQSMPANPRQRNFWALLAQHRQQIPQQTYDYVFSIVSAAVIGENPRLFGFDFDNPLAELEDRHSQPDPGVKRN